MFGLCCFFNGVLTKRNNCLYLVYYYFDFYIRIAVTGMFLIQYPWSVRSKTPNQENCHTFVSDCTEY